MTRLSKTASVLTLFNVGGAHASYSAEPDSVEEILPASVVHLPLEKYEELGKPDEITVTIEPGNTLEDAS